MSIFKNDIIVVDLVKENKSSWVPEGKNGSLRLEGTTVQLDVPLTERGVMQILSKEEQDVLEQSLDPTRPKGWLSPYARDNAWTGKNRFKVELGERPVEFNMNNPKDYIMVKILEANSQEVAPSYSERTDRKYKYFMDKKESIDEEANAKYAIKFKAMDIVSKLGKDNYRMENLLLVLNRGSRVTIGKQPSSGFLQRSLMEFADTNSKKLVETYEDENYEYKVYYFRAIDNGTIVRNGFEHKLGWGDNRHVGSGDSEVIDFIKNLKTDTDKQEEWQKFVNRIKK